MQYTININICCTVRIAIKRRGKKGGGGGEGGVGGGGGGGCFSKDVIVRPMLIDEYFHYYLSLKWLRSQSVHKRETQKGEVVGECSLFKVMFILHSGCVLSVCKILCIDTNTHIYSLLVNLINP